MTEDLNLKQEAPTGPEGKIQLSEKLEEAVIRPSHLMWDLKCNLYQELNRKSPTSLC